MWTISLKLLNILIFLYSFTLIRGRTVHRSEDGFSHMVDSLLEQLKRNYSMDDTIKKAREKLKETEFETWNETEKSAALIINIFTSSDVISIEPEMTFHSILQKQLRGGHPNKIWKQCEELLNDALEIIGVEKFEHVYRGEREWPATFPDEGHTYFVPSFWSTTVDPVITKYFGGAKGFFYHILGAKGVRVENISVIYKEKEVLVPSAGEYKVIGVLRNATEIQEELSRITKWSSGADLSTFTPKVLIVLAEKTNYIRINTTTRANTHFCVHGSDANLIPPENSYAHKTFEEYKFALYLVFCIHVLKRGTFSPGNLAAVGY